jgi:hypothetical protein
MQHETAAKRAIKQESTIMKLIAALGLILATQIVATQGAAQQLEYFGRPVRAIPVSSVVKPAR